MTDIILASASPRRAALLQQIGITPAWILPADIDETAFEREKPSAYAVRMAVSKAEKIAAENKGSFILAADTAVACGARILPKAETREQAAACLDLLSGRRHVVYGGICLITPDGKVVSRLVKTAVVFARLTKAEKKAYLDSNDWSGKAGGYAIQGVAAAFVRQIMGSYSNVVGLGLYETAAMLKGNGALK